VGKVEDEFELTFVEGIGVGLGHALVCGSWVSDASGRFEAFIRYYVS
ncbi:MAG: hypothetical protein AVDCRST_MAG86-2481, partial [uncultured Truepera sp.]